MEKIITNSVWRQVSRLFKGGNKIAAIAYVSKGTPLSFAEGDTLVCDASDHAIKSGETDAKTLSKFVVAGAQVYSCPNLHAKVLICADLVVIGSANLSASSENHLVEASLVTTRSQIRSQASALIHSFIKASTRIDGHFINRISSLPVKRQPARFTRRSSKPRIKETGGRYWIVGTSLLTKYPEDEEKYIERGEEKAREVLEDTNAEVAWIRWTGESRFRKLAKPGDTVVEIRKYKRKATVFGPKPVLVRQHHQKWTRFYFGESGGEMSWTAFEKELSKVGLRKIKKTSTRELNQRDISLIESIW